MLLTFVESDMSDVSQEWMSFMIYFSLFSNKLAFWVYAIRFRTSKNLNLNVIVLHGSENETPSFVKPVDLIWFHYLLVRFVKKNILSAVFLPDFSTIKLVSSFA